MFTEYKHNRANKLISQFTLSSALRRDFRSISLGWPREGFVVEHVVLSRAGIGSNFDQF